MRKRCNNPRTPRYPDYGGRGIKVCKRWDKFDNFLADMGSRPPGMSLDRKNNNGNYTPRNCQWASSAEQSRNSRRSIKYTHKGVTLCQMDWAVRWGVHQSTLSKRIKKHGWRATATYYDL